jgi:1-aminocyclopropane-1-carboxylate deaminase/D-cysteine desulfhydrase-like pyridoxal-dependent ACC family enzyme
MNAGIVAQNILLLCTSIDLVGCPCAEMNKETLKQLLSLNENQLQYITFPFLIRRTDHKIRGNNIKKLI